MDYNSLIKSITKKTSGDETGIDPTFDTFGDFLETLIKVQHKEKGNNTTLFSEFYGQESTEGKVHEFKVRNLRFNKLNQKMYVGIGLGDVNVKEEVSAIMREYHNQLIAKTKWMGLMGILERLLIQYDCYAKARISYSTQKQKSGDKKFEYILLRSPFFDLIEGKIEIRVYYTKMEDYPTYSSIEDLVNGNKDFVSKSKKEVKDKMYEIIKNNPITFLQIKEALKKVETDFDRKEVDEHEKKRVRLLKKHNFDSENNDLTALKT